MKMIFRILFLVSIFYSCNTKEANYTKVIVENGVFSKSIIKTLTEPDKMLLLGYLFTYGNECDETSTKIKCQILTEFSIDNECETAHIENLKKWFVKEDLLKYKLNKCPSLPIKAAIQNDIKKIVLRKDKDTLSINFSVIGMNTSQEKNWDIEVVKKYLVKNKMFIPLN